MITTVLALSFIGAQPLHTLVVGGGPEPQHNQVAIEGNVRYVHKILPSKAPVRVLFADGDPKAETVLYERTPTQLSYRTPQLPRMDGPAKLLDFRLELGNLKGNVKPNTPVLLYFTGHGSPNPYSSFEDNIFDMWGGDRLTVSTLASMLKVLPNDVPVTLVMVQCYSGAFGNLLFESGVPTGPLVDRNLCGFFAAVAQREAAGCTPEVDEASYRDFTSFFFAALAGVDRVGRPVSNADYDKNGTVGMNEAFAYSLIHDDSIDTPVCTSDTFLRRFVKTPDEDVFSVKYSDVRSWATPAQVAALEALSTRLALSGEDRLKQAFDQFRAIRPVGPFEREDPRVAYIIRFVRLAKTVVLGHQMESSNAPEKKRYRELLAAEARNPLKG